MAAQRRSMFSIDFQSAGMVGGLEWMRCGSGFVMRQARDHEQKYAWCWMGRCECVEEKRARGTGAKRRINSQCRDDRLVVDTVIA